MKYASTVLKSTWRYLAGLLLFISAVPMAFAVITGNPSKFIVLDNTDTGFSVVGTWATVTTGDTTVLRGPTYGWDTRTHVGTPTETASAIWSMGSFPSATGSYGFDVFVPATIGSINSAAAYRLEEDSGCSGTWVNIGNFSAFDQNTISNEGQFRRIGSMTLTFGRCYRVVLSSASSSAGLLYADAVRVERLFESKATIPDMPFASTAFAPGTTSITSASNAAPTIVATLVVTCPANGSVVITASGESTAQADGVNTGFIGLAYSISRNSTATDNANVVQSSALATFPGDANRDFLNVQRMDSCTAGSSNTYRLTAYRGQLPATGTGSFVWNGRLIAQFFP